MTRHQFGISALGSQTSFSGETSGSVAKCWLFSQATLSSSFFNVFFVSTLLVAYISMGLQFLYVFYLDKRSFGSLKKKPL